MGCDIHVYMERKHKGVWVAVNPEPAPESVKHDYSIHHWGRYVETDMMEELAMALEEPEDQVPRRAQEWHFGRHYDAFAQLAGVRGDEGMMQYPSGIPADASIQVWREAMMMVVPDVAEEDENLSDDIGYIADKVAVARGYRRSTRDGAEWVMYADWHTPSAYTLEGLKRCIESNEDDELPVEGRVRDLLRAMEKVASDFSLGGEDVRTVFWFDN